MLNKERKCKIGEDEYSFKMTNRTVLAVDDKYGNYAKVIKGLMDGEQFYTNALKLLSCSCTEKEFELDYLAEMLTPGQLNLEVPDFAVELYFDYIGIARTDGEEEAENTEKN